MNHPSKKLSSWLIYKSWMHSLASWTHAVTFTFKRSNGRGQTINEQIMIDALRHFLRALDRRCFGRNETRKGMVVSSAVVIGWGSSNDHPHAHLSLSTPSHLDVIEFTAFAVLTASEIDWFDHHKVFKSYVSEGWSSYLVDHGPENIIDSLLRAPQVEIST